LKVSIPLIAYNQERFIAQAIEGVLMQRTKFDFELLVGDDCSTDGTRAVVDQYAARDPRVRPLDRPRNLGMNRNFWDALSHCRGQYVAMLEGDDYWTDETKLQRQADYLDAHAEVAVVHHRVLVREEATGRTRRDPRFRIRRRKTLDDLLRRGNFLHTASTMFRRTNLGDAPPPWFFDLEIGDLVLHAMNAAHGEIAYLPRTMSVYRVHGGGVHSLLAENARHENLLTTLGRLDEYFQGTQSGAIAQLREYVQTVQKFRRGDIAEAREHARARLRMGRFDAQAVTAALVLYAPWLYRLARRVVP
jgi:glycosyltransferase involved in cell wall biosynthesis